MVKKETLENILPDWKVFHMEGKSYFELSRYSPAGEEILMEISGNTLEELAEAAEEYHNGFDPEDEAAMKYHAKHYGDENQRRFYKSAPDSLEDLLEDARWIDRAFYDVQRRIWKAGYKKRLKNGKKEK